MARLGPEASLVPGFQYPFRARIYQYVHFVSSSFDLRGHQISRQQSERTSAPAVAGCSPIAGQIRGAIGSDSESVPQDLAVVPDYPMVLRGRPGNR